ncbi:MAG: PilZ domain-containing protein [Geobacter sp.]|nr:PilZ domain-containing protein [Geobacter sp.]
MEKRRFVRVPLKVEAYVSCRSIAFKGEVANLSLNGMFIACNETLEEGDIARITLYLTGTSRRLDVSITANGRVIRVGEGMVAFQFQDMDLDSFAQLRNIISFNAGDADRVINEFMHAVVLADHEERKAS